MSKTSKPIADQLRVAIRKAEKRGITRYQIAKQTGISNAQLSRLMAGTVAPRIDTTERIADAIGYRLSLLPLTKGK